MVRGSQLTSDTREPPCAMTGVVYDILFERYPTLAPMFPAARHGVQAEMLASALTAVLDHLEDDQRVVSVKPRCMAAEISPYAFAQAAASASDQWRSSNSASAVSRLLPTSSKSAARTPKRR